MQTYAVVERGFEFVKIGRTDDLKSRIATLQTANPRELILMALFDGDIERDMHRLCDGHRARLEWFRYNEHTESLIIARMEPTKEWFGARKQERQSRRRGEQRNQMGPLDLSLLSAERLDQIAGIGQHRTNVSLWALFGIPSEADLNAMIRDARKDKLVRMRMMLADCGHRVRTEIEDINRAGSPDPERLRRALFAREVVKNWRRRVGMELGAIMSDSLTISRTAQ